MTTTESRPAPQPPLPPPDILAAATAKARAERAARRDKWHAQDVAASVRRPELDGVLLSSALHGLWGVLMRAAAKGDCQAGAWRLLPRRDYAVGQPPIPGDLVGAARQFWDACEAAGLSPAIRLWDAERTSGRTGWEIALRWPGPPETPAAGGGRG